MMDAGDGASTIRAALLQMGPVVNQEDWSAYDRNPELQAASDADILALIEPYPASEVNLDDAVNWVPVRGWRIAAVRGLAACLDPMLAVADHPDDHLASLEFPAVAERIGEKAAAPLLLVLADENRSTTQRQLAASALGAVACRGGPTVRENCISALSRQVEFGPVQDAEINGAAAQALIALKAISARDVLFRAFRAGRVNLGVAGAEELEAAFGDWRLPDEDATSAD
jgi:hypothetical protein